MHIIICERNNLKTRNSEWELTFALRNANVNASRSYMIRKRNRDPTTDNTAK